MRVTEHTNYETIRNSITRSKSRMEDLQLKNATLKKLNAPSDDPIGAAKVLEVRTDKVNNDQYQANAHLAQAFLNNSEQALNELSDIVVRCKEIALSQASGASTTEYTRLGVAEEVTQLFQQAVATANRRVGDRYLFGGYQTQKPPVDPDGRYQGDNGQMMVEIGKDVFISMNLPGLETFNTNPLAAMDKGRVYENPNSLAPNRGPASINPGEDKDLRSTTLVGLDPDGLLSSELAPGGKQNVNLFDEVQKLRISLLTGDVDGIRDTLDNFDNLHSKLVSMRAKVGSRVQGIQNSSQALERHNITNAQLTSQIEDADMAQVVSDLTKEETVFRSTLQSAHKLVQPTLMDFLK